MKPVRGRHLILLSLCSCLKWTSSYAQLSISVDPQNPSIGDNVKITCTINPFLTGTASWFYAGSSVSLTTCDNTGFCSTTSDGSYTFSSNGVSIIVMIMSFDSDRDSKTWTCQYGSSSVDKVITAKSTLRTVASTLPSATAAKPTTAKKVKTTQSSSDTRQDGIIIGISIGGSMLGLLIIIIITCCCCKCGYLYQCKYHNQDANKICCSYPCCGLYCCRKKENDKQKNQDVNIDNLAGDVQLNPSYGVSSAPVESNTSTFDAVQTSTSQEENGLVVEMNEVMELYPNRATSNTCIQSSIII